VNRKSCSAEFQGQTRSWGSERASVAQTRELFNKVSQFHTIAHTGEATAHAPDHSLRQGCGMCPSSRAASAMASRRQSIRGLGSNGTEKALKLGCLFGSVQNLRDYWEKSRFCVFHRRWRLQNCGKSRKFRRMFCENAAPGLPISAMMRAQNILSKA
jgi:hypothetical protein